MVPGKVDGINDLHVFCGMTRIRILWRKMWGRAFILKIPRLIATDCQEWHTDVAEAARTEGKAI